MRRIATRTIPYLAVCHRLLLMLLACATFLSPAAAQQKEVQHDNQLWFGYMTTARISDRFSIWNDVHYIPNGFAVARTGITHHFANRLDVTAGYAYVRLPLAGELRRSEHRPWAQVQLLVPLGANFQLQHRLRWDLRYRQRVVEGEITDGYTFNHRGRVQAVLRKSLPQLAFKGITPSLVLADELLMNLGKEVTLSHFDQNRLSLMAGFRYKGLMLQAGYMNRYVQTAVSGSYTSNHTFVTWLFHTFDLRKKEPQTAE